MAALQPHHAAAVTPGAGGGGDFYGRGVVEGFSLAAARPVQSWSAAVERCDLSRGGNQLNLPVAVQLSNGRPRARQYSAHPPVPALPAPDHSWRQSNGIKGIDAPVFSLAMPSNRMAARKPASPPGYQALGPGTTIAKRGSKVCLQAGAATVEVTALTPDLFRVGFFPQGRPADYGSVAVVVRDWQSGPVTVTESTGEVTLGTSAATAHLSLDPVRIGFTDGKGRAFAMDDRELGMGWFTASEESPVGELANQSGTLGSPVRVYKQHLAGEHYFGCGERTGELDKTGSHQMFWNVDPPPGHTALQNNLYASIPFTLVLDAGRAWGFFLDSPTRVEFDLAHDDPQRAWFGAGNGDIVYYVFCGPTPGDVLARYTELTGHTPLPPLWALGYGQSRFSYETAEEVRQIARSFRERDIPCDTLYFDIDSLDGYRVFTWSKTGFPDPEGLLAELKEMGFHAVSIVDAGVKVDDHYPVYTEGKSRDLFCKTPEGTDYLNAVWPGTCSFPA